MSDATTGWEHDGDLTAVLDHLIQCAETWDPKARLLGNARAEDIIRGIRALREERDAAVVRAEASRSYAIQRNEVTGPAIRDLEAKLTAAEARVRELEDILVHFAAAINATHEARIALAKKETP